MTISLENKTNSTAPKVQELKKNVSAPIESSKNSTNTTKLAVKTVNSSNSSNVTKENATKEIKELEKKPAPTIA